ncbi:hypothetical protein GUJ93_ZPchr0011g28683 [Zizania palustris]|uniref:Uncharacterized protein n=1 Tax=Zizania palustris TaxID=103762 RepID=A0A8J5WIC6_ZIZPA|nr:hypothetical protein GUJ93_ZPchr0011g28683 [Zizania palustris]
MWPLATHVMYAACRKSSRAIWHEVKPAAHFALLITVTCIVLGRAPSDAPVRLHLRACVVILPFHTLGRRAHTMSPYITSLVPLSPQVCVERFTRHMEKNEVEETRRKH